MLTELGYLMPVWASVKLETQAQVPSMFDSLKERNHSLYEKVADDIYCLKRDSVFEPEPKVATERNPDVETYSRRYGELHAQAIRRRIGHSLSLIHIYPCRVGCCAMRKKMLPCFRQSTLRCSRS